MTYLSRYSMRWYSQKNIFQTEVFFSNLQTYKKNGVFISLQIREKNTSGWKNVFFCEYHRLEYRDRYVVCKFDGRGIFVSEISSRGAKVLLKMHENIINFKALPIFLPKGDSWGFSICHSWYLAEQNDTKKALILIFSGFNPSPTSLFDSNLQHLD